MDSVDVYVICNSCRVKDGFHRIWEFNFRLNGVKVNIRFDTSQNLFFNVSYGFSLFALLDLSVLFIVSTLLHVTSRILIMCPLILIGTNYIILKITCFISYTFLSIIKFVFLPLRFSIRFYLRPLFCEIVFNFIYRIPK